MAAKALRMFFSSHVGYSEFGADMMYCAEKGLDPVEYLKRPELSRFLVRIAQELTAMASTLQRYEDWLAETEQRRRKGK